MAIVVKYAEKFYYDFVKFDKRYKKHVWIEKIKVLADPEDLKKLSRKRDTRILCCKA